MSAEGMKIGPDKGGIWMLDMERLQGEPWRC
jgi:hypothetical protein